MSAQLVVFGWGGHADECPSKVCFAFITVQPLSRTFAVRHAQFLQRAVTSDIVNILEQRRFAKEPAEMLLTSGSVQVRSHRQEASRLMSPKGHLLALHLME